MVAATTRNVLIIHFNIVVYALAFWLTNPLLPFLLKEQGASSLSLGVMQSLFNVVQLAGGLVVGYLQDHYSGSAALSVTQLGSALVYVALFAATNVTMLYLSRLPTVLQQSMQVAQAYISKSAEGEQRTVAMSRLSLSYISGMIVGSSSSGYIADAFGMRANAAIAVGLSALCIFVNWAFLQPVDIHAEAAKKKDDAAAAKTSDAPTKKDENYVTLALAMRRVLVFLAFLYAVRSMFEPTNNLTLIDRYALTKTSMGTLTSVMAALAGAANIVGLPLLLKFVSERKLTRVLVLLVAVAYTAMAALPMEDVRVYVTVLGAQAVMSAMLYTTCVTYAVSNAPKEHYGKVVAMSHALRSAVGIACPVLGTWLLSEYGAPSVAVVCAGSLIAALAVM